MKEKTMEQKCTIQELINKLNKQVYENGYGFISEIKLCDGGEVIIYKNTSNPQ